MKIEIYEAQYCDITTGKDCCKSILAVGGMPVKGPSYAYNSEEGKLKTIQKLMEWVFHNINKIECTYTYMEDLLKTIQMEKIYECNLDEKTVKEAIIDIKLKEIEQDFV